MECNPNCHPLEAQRFDDLTVSIRVISNAKVGEDFVAADRFPKTGV